MPYVTTKEMLINAENGGYAIGAFNVENMEMILAVVKVAAELHAPVIMQTTPSTVTYAGLAYYHALVREAAASVSVPVALHLDHGSQYGMVMKAFRQGYSSIMIDGSQESFEENIKLTKNVVSVCTPSEIPVEAELGKVGGKEDGMDGGAGDEYTDPSEAKEFIRQTGISSLAIAIGTAHGIYKGNPNLDFERLKRIKEISTVPLVLHGASGIPDEDVQKAIACGISKVNFATELRIAYSEGVKTVIGANTAVIDPKKYGAAGMEFVKDIVRKKILVCGCNNHV